MTTVIMPTQAVINAFEAANDRWVTCDWPTEFGVFRLNLINLRSFQIDRLAFATSGQESQEWRKAAAWVRQIEKDASHVQELATQARTAFLQHDHARAITLAEQAVQLEKSWHSKPIWESLLQSIRAEFQA